MNYFLRLERNFKEAKRLKEESETLTQQGVESQEKLESLLKELAEDGKLLEEAQKQNADLEVEINEKERLNGTIFVVSRFLFVLLFRALFNYQSIRCEGFFLSFFLSSTKHWTHIRHLVLIGLEGFGF